MTTDAPIRQSRKLVLWSVLAVSCAVAAGLDVFIAISMTELWPLVAAICALLAAAACVWVAVDERQGAPADLNEAEQDPASEQDPVS